MSLNWKNNINASLILLGLSVVVITVIFLSYNTYGNWSFSLALRGRKILAFLIVGFLVSFSTISFQTISQSHFLTPSILGLDSLYILIQTVLFFVLGQNYQGNLKIFFFNIVIMVSLSIILISTLLTKEKQDLFFLLLMGIILGTLFRSVSTFLQVLMEPNEYDKLQGKLFASFNNVDLELLFLVVPVVILIIILFCYASARLDILHLGIDQAINLGIDVHKFRVYILFLISLSVALSTALIGPITFLGFIVANMTYQSVNTYKHIYLFVFAALLSILLLIFGQFLVDHLFQMKTTLNVVIEFIGGFYFIWKILKQKGENS